MIKANKTFLAIAAAVTLGTSAHAADSQSTTYDGRVVVKQRKGNVETITCPTGGHKCKVTLTLTAIGFHSEVKQVDMIGGIDEPDTQLDLSDYAAAGMNDIETLFNSISSDLLFGNGVAILQ